jgi:hypothetical protein
LSPGEVFDEPTVMELALGESRLRQALQRGTEWTFPTSSWHSEFLKGPSSVALTMTLSESEWLGRSEDDRPLGIRAMEFRSALNNRFTLDRLRGQVAAQRGGVDLGLGSADAALLDRESSFDFATMNAMSFLPELVRLSDQHSLNLVLVRLRRRPIEDNRPFEDRRLGQYMDDLESWLHQKGIPIFDLTGESELTLDWYGEGDHIATSHTTRYTELLHARLKSVFEGVR